MKKITLIFLTLFFVLLSLQNTNAQTAGFNSTFAVLSINGSSNQYYDLQATTGNSDFNGLNLGSFNSSNSLLLKGAEHNVYKCGGCDLTSTRVYYRVYKTNSTPGSFSNLNIGYSSGGANGCGGEDQQWSNTGYSVDVLSGLTAGNYTFEVYSDASVTCLGGTIYAGNSGANYKATFNYCGSLSGALPVGEYSIPGCFPTVASAVTYLNSNGVTGTGTVQFNVAAGHTETAPTSGIILNGLGTSGSLATGTSTTQIVFKKSGLGANPIISAPQRLAGGLNDGIIKIIASDYVTFDGFKLVENPLNTITTTGATNTMTEVGIGIFLGSTTNGAQNNTIQNCTISLNENYQNSFGILSSSSSSSTNAAMVSLNTNGTNSYNKIYGNIISNVAYGIYVISEQATTILNETGWDIGGTSLATGNTITFGNPTASNINYTRFSAVGMAGIYFRNNAGVNVQFNTITSYPNSYTQNNVAGIFSNRTSTVNPNGITYTNQISNNIINLTNNGLLITSGIDFGYGNSTASLIGNNNNISIIGGASGASTGFYHGIKANYISNNVNFSNNTISINQSGSGTFSGTVYFINADGNTNDLVIENNNLFTTGSHLKTTGQFFGISHDALTNNSLSIGSTIGTGNIINISRSGIGTFNVHGVFVGTFATGVPNGYTINFNSITISNPNGTAGTFGINDTSGNSSANKFYNNNVINLLGSTGVTMGEFLTFGNINTSNNTISLNSAANTTNGIEFSSNGSITSGFADNNIIEINTSGLSPIARGINTSATSVTNGYTITNNNINGISTSTTTGNPIIMGIRVGEGTNSIVSGNTIKNLSAASTSGNATVNGIAITSGTNAKIFRNNINSISNLSSGAVSTLSGIAISSFTPVGSTDIYNNLISGFNAPSIATSYGIVGIACNTPFSSYKVYYNTIKLGTAASPLSGGTNFGAIGVGVTGNSASTILDLRNNIINMNIIPSGDGFASCVGFSSGTANTTPFGFASTSNSNIYSINEGINNYLFAQGSSTTSPIVNGFALSGLTPNTTNNINNDVNFNATCGIYKSFMGGTRESATYNENNLVATSPSGAFVPSGNSFAENNAETVASITTDFNSVNRTPTNDRGAIQFEGTALTFTNPNTIPTFDAVAPICSGTPLADLPITSTNGVTGTWSPSMNNNVTTTYTFTPTVGQCASIVTLTIEVIPSIFNTTTITACNSYTWSVNGTTYTSSGTYTNVNGCTTDTLQLTIQPLLTFYQDADADGYGNPEVIVVDCIAPIGYVLIGTDCNDTNSNINPGAIDICYDGIDNDCNGIIDNVGQPGGCIPIITVLQPTSCGITYNNISQSFYATTIPGAQGYSFRVKNMSTNAVQLFQRSVNNLSLAQIPGATYGTDYQIEVGVKYNNVWQPFYGTPCIISIASPQATIGTYCGTTLTSMNQWIYANYVARITLYRFRVTNTVTNQVEFVTSSLNRFNMTQIPNRTFNTVYLVEVSLRNTDGTFLPYGTGCTITTPSLSPSRIVETESISKLNTIFRAVAYPNPFVDDFKLNIETTSSEAIEIKIYDMLGKIIENKTIISSEIDYEIGRNLSSGVYNIILIQGENTQTVRVIKR
ncbi:T9SS type A sorting domain-containing protein [Flavobacterium sp.]|uniref:T9SS type A sorting domain-containing protein n=1 Tax=Flavobacterium sp. TaxID=239 RepID=UPI0026125602|nr:T9SS type A sorting domain-containing protein [Flavobacterium sp.]